MDKDVKLEVIVYECASCGTQFSRAKPPAQCPYCGVFADKISVVRNEE